MTRCLHQGISVSQKTIIDASIVLVPSTLERVTGDHRRHELAAFLRARRDELQPEDVGLARHGRRRVKGLRRHEVADLAGVSVTWYTFVEQERDIRISPDMLDALARALRLDDDSLRYVRRLAGVPVGDTVALTTDVDTDLRELLEDVLPSPASITTAAFDLVAWNQSYCALFGQDPGELPPERRNALWSFYASQTLRTELADWENETSDAVARFRAETARTPCDSRVSEIVDDLSKVSSEFRVAWDLHHVRSFVGRTQTFRNQKVGDIRLQVGQFRPVHQPALTVMIHHPSDNQSYQRLSKLLELEKSTSIRGSSTNRTPRRIREGIAIDGTPSQ
jgi:transcriptional regulator with XRE-family HTH domain